MFDGKERNSDTDSEEEERESDAESDSSDGFYVKDKKKALSSSDHTPQIQPPNLSPRQLNYSSITTMVMVPEETPPTVSATVSATDTFDRSGFDRPIPNANSTRNGSQNESQNGAGSQNNSQESPYQKAIIKYLMENKEAVAIDFIYNGENIVEKPVNNKPLKLKFVRDTDTNQIIEKSKEADRQGTYAKVLTKYEFRNRLEKYPDSFEMTYLGVSVMQKLHRTLSKDSITDDCCFKNLDQKRWFLQIVQKKIIEEDRVEGDETELILQPSTGNT